MLLTENTEKQGNKTRAEQAQELKRAGYQLEAIAQELDTDIETVQALLNNEERNPE